MKKIVALSVLLVFITSSCKNSDDIELSSNSIVFGQFANFCHGDCFNAFKLYDDVLFIDENVSRYKQGYVFRPTAKLSEEKFIIAKHLLEEIPESLMNAEDGTIYGCPDCSDQSGTYLQLNFNGETKVLLIDYYDHEITNEEIINYRNKILNVLGELYN